MKKTIEIKCQGSALRPIDDLLSFQGTFKHLTDENYTKLKTEILRVGFVDPIIIWNNNILDGHQRLTTLTRLRTEGYTIPPIPVTLVSAKDHAEAKRIVLSLASQYGTISDSGLVDFMREADISLSELESDFSLMGIDLDDITRQLDGLDLDVSVPKFQTQLIQLDSLKPHPKNYRKHTPDQLTHIAASIKDHGFYRNVVTSRDNTILAGHGVVEACRLLKMKKIPVFKLDIDPNDTRALKVVTGDNEIARLGEVDDRQLSEILKDIAEDGFENLLGTGFDKQRLTNLVFVSRPASEVKDFDAAAEWVGLPEYDEENKSESDPVSILVRFDDEKDRDLFLKEKQMKPSSTRGNRWTAFWPERDRHDLKSVRFKEVKK